MCCTKIFDNSHLPLWNWTSRTASSACPLCTSKCCYSSFTSRYILCHQGLQSPCEVRRLSSRAQGSVCRRTAQPSSFLCLLWVLLSFLTTGVSGWLLDAEYLDFSKQSCTRLKSSFRLLCSKVTLNILSGGMIESDRTVRAGRSCVVHPLGQVHLCLMVSSKKVNVY